MPYKSEIAEAALVKKRKEIKKFFGELKKQMDKIFMIIKINEDSLGKYTDASLEVNKKFYAFRFITSKYPVSLNSNKFWKVRRKEINMGDKSQRNPLRWFPGTVKADYYIYPVKNPENEMKFNEEIEFVGNYKDAIIFIKKRIEKDL